MSEQRLTHNSLYQRWRDRWQDFLTDIETAETTTRIEERLRDKVTIGNAERKIAGGHEGREILELLQNARDAIQRGNASTGRVYVGIYDEGVLVANTGSHFDFFDPQVENAVTMIGETGKGDDTDGQSIGHKGVGLKSILATGDSFEIYTQPNRDDDSILGVRLSRSYLLAAILDRLGKETPLEVLAQDVDDEQLQEVLTDYSVTTGLSLSGVDDDLSKLPLFNFPIPLDVRTAKADSVTDHAVSLLQGTTSANVGNEDEQFRTAVFVRYEDREWRNLLDEWDIPLPREGSRTLANRPNRIWDYLSAQGGDDGLKTETIVQLGEIEELVLERHSGEELVASETWHIESAQTDAPSDGPLRHDDVRVKITSTELSKPLSKRFDLFQFDPDREHNVKLLIRKTADEVSRSFPETYPLYLYYPIQNTATSAFPFCLHGQFRVETNRKDLSSNRLSDNQQVLEEGADLISEVAQATADISSSESPYGDLYPWILFPPVTEQIPETPTTQAELLRWFSGVVYDRLRTTASIPVCSSGQTAALPSQTILYWKPRVLDGYRALLALVDSEIESRPSVRALPSVTALTALSQFPESWYQRVHSLVESENTDEALSRAITRDWAKTLSATMADEGSVSLGPVNAARARNLLIATADLIQQSSGDDSEIWELFDELAPDLDGTPLLPCRVRDTDHDELQLVPIEQRQSPEGSRTRTAQSRSVIWDIESSTKGTGKPPTPPRKSNFTVYFLDSAVEENATVRKILNLAGRAWGIRAYEGIPSFYRSLLDTFSFGDTDRIEPNDLAFLAALIDDIGVESGDLQTGESRYFPLDYLQSAIQQSEGDQRRNLRRRVRLRDASVRLPDMQTAISIRDTVFGDEWQRLLLKHSSNADTVDADSSDNSPLARIEYPAEELFAPSHDPWQRIQRAIKRDTSDADIARTLSLLGASALPSVNIVWMYGDDHPSMNRPTAWNPSDWPETEFAGDPPARIESLLTVLDQYDGEYQTWVTAPGYHSADTAGHSDKCSVKHERKLEKTNIGAWVWFDNEALITDIGSGIIELLNRHGTELSQSILQTGWTCTYGHSRKDWQQPIPSLLNWQLRHLPVWDAILETHEDIADRWDEYRTSLRYAVVAEGERGAQAARLFPHVDPDSDGVPDEAVLETLGVTTIDRMNVTQVASRLQKLQETLSDDGLEHGPTRLVIPSERENDWNRAYTQLLKPILRQLPDDDDDESAAFNWPFLTHLPLRDGGEWMTASIDWIRETSDQIRYFEDQSPKPWETQKIAEENFYVLPRTAEGPFTRLTTQLGVDRVDASKLVFDAGDLRFIGDDHPELTTIKEQLYARRDLLVASTETTQEDRIRETADTLVTAIDGLDVAHSFPERARRQLSDPASGLYRTASETDALVFNRDATDETLNPDELAMGLALLVERPTNVARFREALQTDVGVEELERRWDQLTFPINTVKRVLGTQTQRELEQRFDTLAGLYARFSPGVELPIDDALETLSSADSELVEITKHWLRTGDDPPDELSTTPSVLAIGTAIQQEFPNDIDFAARRLFETSSPNSWATAIAEADIEAAHEIELIDWIESSAHRLPVRPFSANRTAEYRRLLSAYRVWETTDAEALAELDRWEERMRDFGRSEELSWCDSLPTGLMDTSAVPNRVFFLADDERFETTVEHFLGLVESDIDMDAVDLIVGALRTYIMEGALPERAEHTGAKQHQDTAFEEITRLMETNGDTNFALDSVSAVTFDGTPSHGLSVRTGANGSGGGSRQFTGRGQQAEAFTMVAILDRLATWFESGPGGLARQFRSAFKRLYKQQQGQSYTWHIEKTWKNDLLPLLDDTSRLQESQIIDWREQLQDGTHLRNLPIIQLINVTMEQGPGFDVIDPLGPLSTDPKHGLDLDFTPVEIKAVDGTEPPFRFRFTTNEYRRCKAFLQHSDHSYLVRLVSVPDIETDNWPADCSFVDEKVLETPAELSALVATENFETVVKGGYMNMELG